MYELDSSRAFAWVEQGVIRLRLQPANPANDFLLLPAIGLRLHVALSSQQLTLLWAVTDIKERNTIIAGNVKVAFCGHADGCR